MLMDQSSQPGAVTPAPVAQQNRIAIIDSLRGFAILGILLMNLPSFSLPSNDPTVYNETGLNYKLWYLVSLIPDGTQRALFSMLFGAGVILFINGKEKNMPGMLPADYFMRRQLWLIVFSLVDVFLLLWSGDILFDYACMGFILFVFRNMPAKKLLMAAVVCLILMMARENRDLYLDKSKIEKGEAIAMMDTTVNKLTLLQKEDLSAMEDFKSSSSPESKLKRAERKKIKMNYSYGTLYDFRSANYFNNLIRYTYLSLWDILEFMFIGMAFLKLGILTGKAKTKIYWWLFLGGMSGGLLLSWLSMNQYIHSNYNGFDYAKNTVLEYYNLHRTLRALGIFGLLMLMYKSGIFKWLFSMMRPVGQMAFTNYLGQSIICGIIFYGIGFGLLGKVERYQAYLIMCCVWLFQIIFCNLWMRYFYFGPLEWLWRSLTYGKAQPMLRRKKE